MHYFPYIIDRSGNSRPALGVVGSPWHTTSFSHSVDACNDPDNQCPGDVAYVIEERERVHSVTLACTVGRLGAEPTSTALCVEPLQSPARSAEVMRMKYPEYLGNPEPENRHLVRALWSPAATADLIHEVLHRCYEESGTWREDHLGSDLAYLILAIADRKEDSHVVWGGVGKDEGDCWQTRRFMEKLFPPEHLVWAYIREEEDA